MRVGVRVGARVGVVPARAVKAGLLLIVVFIIVLKYAPPSSVFSSSSDSSSLLFTVAKRYEPLAWMRGADRFSSGANIFLQDADGRHPLVSTFAASADPAVSFDGKRVLFAGKQKAEDHWQIWEVALDIAQQLTPHSALTAGSPRRITSCLDDCVRPFYLPDERLVYAKKFGGRFVIEASDLEGNAVGPVQLTYSSGNSSGNSPGNSLPTDVLRDGRILFEAAYPLGTNGVPELYTVYSDGSGVESYRCDHGNARYSGKQIASGDIVFVSDSGLGLGRFTSARANEVHISAPAGNYAGESVETSSGDWLLAWRPDKKSYFQVRRWKLAGGSLTSIALSTASSPVAEDESANIIQPTLVVERTTPKRHPSGLHDWPDANLLCLNAYTSKYKFAPGSIRSVRLYLRNDTGTAKLLGSAPVESDGSFFVQVPTEQPLQIELLDGSGKTLKRQAGWFWLRRGEQRGCVGCHAGPETAPENAVPMILLKSTTPADMTGANRLGSSGGQ